MNEIKCIFCDTKSDRVAIRENGYQGKQCPDCGLIYISPRPSLQEVIDLYGHDEAHIPPIPTLPMTLPKDFMLNTI